MMSTDSAQIVGLSIAIVMGLGWLAADVVIQSPTCPKQLLRMLATSSVVYCVTALVGGEELIWALTGGALGLGSLILGTSGRPARVFSASALELEGQAAAGHAQSLTKYRWRVVVVSVATLAFFSYFSIAAA